MVDSPDSERTSTSFPSMSTTSELQESFTPPFSARALSSLDPEAECFTGLLGAISLLFAGEAVVSGGLATLDFSFFSSTA